MRASVLVLLSAAALAVACARTGPADVVERVEVAAAPEVSPPSPQPVPTGAPTPPPVGPSALYESCRDRVEGPEQDGECTSDVDCGTAGCSQEVCLPASHAAEIMTTCEILPCFAVLERCGCVEGRCSWTVGRRPGAEPVALPGRVGAQ